MKSIPDLLSSHVAKALQALLPEEQIEGPYVVASQNPKLADYQCNMAMRLTKKLKKAPRQIAEDLVQQLKVDDISETPEIAGPGFINFRIKQSFLISQLQSMAADQRLGLSPSSKAEKILIDFSGPNLAKEMHVGHLRSTIIGDSIARFLEFEGHEVIRMNHVGDWGTQFGMLIQYIREEKPESLNQPESFEIENLENFYRAAKQRFDESEDFANAARKAVVDLQAGDPTTLAVWKVFCDESLKHCHKIYQHLDIKIEDRGESAYNDMLPNIVEELKTSGLAVQTQGAWGVFLEGYETSDGEPMPTIVQKSDGGYIYSTTDLAAIQYRMNTLNVDRAIYVTDARQYSHFDQVFSIAEKMNWCQKKQLKHIGFGMMLGQDGKPFKTREGGTIKLKDLMEESKERAYQLAKELSPELNKEELETISSQAGIGGIKYSDLAHGIATDYKFSWDKMLAKDGNTAFYLLITYARTRSVGRKAGVDCFDLLQNPNFIFEKEPEIQLAKNIVKLLHLWPQVVQELTPNVLLNYLYEISKDFGTFWNACPILKLEDESLKQSRLALCGLTGKVLSWGLSMVGIQALEKI